MLNIVADAEQTPKASAGRSFAHRAWSLRPGESAEIDWDGVPFWVERHEGSFSAQVHL